MNQKLTKLLALFHAAALLLTPVACQNPTGGETQNPNPEPGPGPGPIPEPGPGPTPNPEPGPGPAPSGALTDIQFGTIDPYKNVLQAKKEVRGKITELINQCTELSNQYAALPSTDKSVQCGFAADIRALETSLSTHFNLYSINSIKTCNKTFDNFIARIGNNFMQPNAAEAFNLKAQAFSKVTVLSTREHFGNGEKAPLEADFATAWTAAMGNVPVPTNYAAAQAQLKTLLQNAMPEETGEPGPNFIQQYEDFYQFYGYANDWLKFYPMMTGVLTTSADKQQDVKLANFIITDPYIEAEQETTRKQVAANNKIIV